MSATLLGSFLKRKQLIFHSSVRTATSLKVRLKMSATVTKPKRQFLIAPSILSADFSKIGSEIKEVELAGCDIIHVDVMDGNFVPNITIGPTVIHSIRKATKLPLDVHLMIHDPIRYLKEFREAGSDWITVHVEACKDVSLTLKQIKTSFFI